MKKMAINPMQSAHAAPRCAAKSKRSGMQCKAPAIKGKRVCRMHGGKSPGAPCGELMAGTFMAARPARQKPHARRSGTLFGRRGSLRRCSDPRLNVAFSDRVEARPPADCGSLLEPALAAKPQTPWPRWSWLA